MPVFDFVKINPHRVCACLIFSMCYSKADDSSLMQRCHGESTSALCLLLQQRRLPRLDLGVPVCACIQNTQMRHLTRVHRIIYLCRYNVFWLSCVNNSMNLNSPTVLSPCVMLQGFAVIAAFSYAAVFDLMKNVNRQAGYVTRCTVSGGFVIGLKTEPHGECDLTQLRPVCLNQCHMLKIKSSAI